MVKALRRCAETFVLAAVFAGCGDHPTAPPPAPESSWELLATGETMGDVWGTSSTDVFALGSSGTLLHYDGTSWKSLPVPRIWAGAIWGTSNHVFVAGERSIYHYDGRQWEPMLTEYPGAFHDVWGTSAQDVFAVGNAATQPYSDWHGVVLHYDGSAWTPMPIGTVNSLQAVWGSSSTDVFAAGVGIMLHYDGSTWTPVPGELGATSLWGSSSTDVFGITESYSGSRIMHYNGIRWDTSLASTDWALHRLWGSSSTDVYAVGDRGTILHYDGVAWQETGGSDSDMYGVWGSSAQDVFVVGGGDFWYSQSGALILHYDGTEWRSEASDLLDGSWVELGSVGGSSATDVYFAGWWADGYPTIRHFDGARFDALYSLNDDSGWADVFAASRDAVFFVGGDGRVSRFDGSAWTTWGLDNDCCYSVWASSGTNAFVPSRGKIYHYDGSTWNALPSGTKEYLSDIWGSSSTDVFAVGSDGAICHYDGSAWTVMPTVTSQSLRAVWGSSGHDVFAVGAAGTMLHYDGSTWEAAASGTQYALCDVWGSSATDVYAVAPQVTLHFDGTRWNRDSTTGGTKIWGSSGNDVYLVDFLRILHYGPR